MARKTLIALSLLLISLVATVPAQAAAQFQLVFAGPAFNDPTPAAPVGGNPGTTLGQQRRNAVLRALEIWGATLDSRVPIHVAVQFVPLNCTATAAVLASAGAFNVNANFVNAEFPNTWYHGALANKRAGFDLAPNSPGSIIDGRDLTVSFNLNLGQPNCLAGSPFYLGFDGNEGAGVDVISTALHEFGHGLGFSQFASVTTGAPFAGLPDIYQRKIFDRTLNMYWNTMSNAQRVASAINTGNVIWDGPNVTAGARLVLRPSPTFTVNAPASVAGSKALGTGSPGGAFPTFSITRDVVLGNDGVDPTSDACTALVNAAAVAGKFALVDRGTCAFTIKAQAAQAAGAAGVIVADNAPGAPAGLLIDASVTIPVVRISQADGAALKAALASGATVSVTLAPDATRLAGSDPNGKVLLNTPNPVAPGSTISHFDPSASPNLIMEPSINADLGHDLKVPADLTLAQMRDIGWYADVDLDMVDDIGDQCPASIQEPVVTISGCNTNVANAMYANGCTISDLFAKCANATTPGGTPACIANTAAMLKANGTIPNTTNVIGCAISTSIASIEAELNAIIAQYGASSKTGDKIEDALDKFRKALTKKDGNDIKGVLGELEGLVGDVEAATKDGLITAATGNRLMNNISGLARTFAQREVAEAAAAGSKKAADAQRYVDEGDSLLAAGRYKDACNRYKDAASKAK